MILQCFSVYDRAAMTFGHPFYMVNAPAAMRSFIDAFDNPQSMLAKHPDDFELRRIASFDDETGRFDSLAVSETVMTGSEVARMRPQHPELPLDEDDTKVGGSA